MLLAVEGGGFFSSSASGYSKGLSLLLLGHRSDEKHMKVAPWNQYQLVEEETDSSDTQLASGKNRVSRGCASFVCFGRASAGLDGQSPLKVGPTQQQQDTPEIIDHSHKESTTILDYANISNPRNVTLKSSLKKPCHNAPEEAITTTKTSSQEELLPQEDGTHLPALTEKRKVQWTDACGKDLAEIREFELRCGSYVIHMLKRSLSSLKRLSVSVSPDIVAIVKLGDPMMNLSMGMGRHVLAG